MFLMSLKSAKMRFYLIFSGNCMAIKIAINGFGRIGRNILRAHFEYQKYPDIQIVAINDTANIQTNAHLTRYDSTHGRFGGKITVDNDQIVINDAQPIRMTSLFEPTQLPWQALGVDIVFECTGKFTSKEKASAHLKAGAKKVIISAPGGDDVDATIVYGINHQILSAQQTVISNASCTTNCLAPLVKPLTDTIGIERGLMTTVHAYTNDQALLDASHADFYRARSATQSIIPTKTGAAKAIGLVLPELKGKLDGFAMRVPVPNVSVVDLTFVAKRETTVREVHDILRNAAATSLKNILVYSDEPLVSVDFNHHPASAIFDATQTKIIGNLVKVVAWYDNEWGFSNRMLDVAQAWMQV